MVQSYTNLTVEICPCTERVKEHRVISDLVMIATFTLLYSFQ
ncbi:hypothetical protein E2C01_091462 [Portunus trituberculatus]|uniref:Uncharacterized protein n=1 Tax=Portunus trituberculatus TaxID=210409 RepID=A0A5B7JT02_PORTR|nr:hypothetical protein [Portunus trituberculatus]